MGMTEFDIAKINAAVDKQINAGMQSQLNKMIDEQSLRSGVGYTKVSKPEIEQKPTQEVIDAATYCTCPKCGSTPGVGCVLTEEEMKHANNHSIHLQRWEVYEEWKKENAVHKVIEESKERIAEKQAVANKMLLAELESW